MSNNPDKIAAAVRSLLTLDPKEDIYAIPDIVRRVCEKTCEVVLGVDPHDIRPESDEDLTYYESSILELGFIKYT